MAKWQQVLIALAFVLCVAYATNAPAATPSAPATTGSKTSGRQAGGAAITGAGIISALSSMIPSGLGNILPVALLFGLGALLVPALGLGLLLREGRRSDNVVNYADPYGYSYYRSFPSFKINTSAIIDGLSDVFERVVKAIDNVDKKYN